MSLPAENTDRSFEAAAHRHSDASSARQQAPHAASLARAVQLRPWPALEAQSMVKDARSGTKRASPDSPSTLIDKRIEELSDWRGQTLSRIRSLILQADPGVIEEWKWRVPVWSHDGIVCTGETYKQVVKLTFAHGASLADPSGLFNSSLEGNTRRAIDIRESDEMDEAAFQALFRAAVAFNTSRARGKGGTRAG